MSAPEPPPTYADPAQRRRIKPVAPTLGARAREFLGRRQTRIYAESVVITALAPAIGFLVQRDDPLFLHNSFSWLAFPPVLVALRHGFGPGVTSALLLVFLAFLMRKPGAVGLAAIPSELLYGTVLLTMIVGQVAASMTRKFHRLEMDYRHLRAQFDGFSRSYMLLELSHERLEQRSISRLSSLRDALRAVFATLPASGGDDVRALADKMLAVMASFGRVQAASVHLVDPGGALEAEPVATVGATQPLLSKDMLVETALSSGEVIHSPGRRDDDAAATTNLLAAVPLVDADERRIGVVAIHALPFVALEESNLRLLFVVAGYMADAMSRATNAALAAGPVSAVAPTGEAEQKDAWDRFTERLARAAADARDPRLPSALMAFWCRKGQRGTEVLEMLIAKDLRATDFPLLHRDADGNPILLIVMPLTDRDGTLAFRGRVDRLCRERQGANLDALGVLSRTWVLDDPDTSKVLAEVQQVTEAHEGAGMAAPPV